MRSAQAVILLSCTRLIHFAHSLPQCPASSGNEFWWNGEECVECTPCSPGKGVKTKCTATQDTVCYDCISGWEYSERSSTTAPCTSCSTNDPNSLCGFPGVHVIQECTPTTKPICNECKVGHYFYNMTLSCVECSPPCKPGQYEEKSCSTKHDRICKQDEDYNATKAGTATTILTNEVTYATKTTAITVGTGTRMLPDASKEGGLLTFLPNPWNWILIASACLFVVLVIISCTLWCWCYKCRRVKREEFHHVEEAVPLRAIPMSANEVLPSPDRSPSAVPSVSSAHAHISCVTLDSLFLHLPATWRRDIAFKLLSKDEYAPWKLIAEELGVCKSTIDYWDFRSSNPAEQLFKHYEKMESSTIRHFIGLLRKQQGGSLLANEIEQGIMQGLSSPTELYPGQLACPPEQNVEEPGEMNSATSEVQETEV